MQTGREGWLLEPLWQVWAGWPLGARPSSLSEGSEGPAWQVVRRMCRAAQYPWCSGSCPLCDLSGGPAPRSALRALAAPPCVMAHPGLCEALLAVCAASARGPSSMEPSGKECCPLCPMRESDDSLTC